MTLRKKTFLSLVGLLTAVAVAGCTSSAPEPETSNGTDTATTQAAESAETRTITDMADREVELSADIETVGTLGSVGVLNAFVQLMGGSDKILNEMPDRFATSGQWDMQYEFSPQLSEGPVFEEGGEVVIEEILANQPDVTFTMTIETAELLEESGIPVVYLEWNDLEDVEEAVTLVGEILDVPELAEEYLTYFDETEEKAAELVADLPEDERLSVLYGDPIEFVQPHVIAEWWIDQAGGISVTDDGREDGSLEYTMEDLLSWDPEVIITTSEQAIQEMQDNDLYADIAALEDERLHTIPTVAHVWGNRTVEQPLTVLWTMHHLYPELMPREDLEEEITNFYSNFFNYDLSEEQVAEIIER